MRHRHTPRVLLVPNPDGTFACPENDCEKSKATWKRGASALQHICACPLVVSRGVRYCLTEAGTKHTKLSAKELRERRRAAAKKYNAKIKAARASVAKTKAAKRALADMQCATSGSTSRRDAGKDTQQHPSAPYLPTPLPTQGSHVRDMFKGGTSVADTGRFCGVAGSVLVVQSTLPTDPENQTPKTNCNRGSSSAGMYGSTASHERDDLIMDDWGLQAVPCSFELWKLPPDCQHSILVHAHRQRVVRLPELYEAAKDMTEGGATFFKIMKKYKVQHRSAIKSKGVLQTHPDKNRNIHPSVNELFRQRMEVLLDKNDKLLDSLDEIEKEVWHTKEDTSAYLECRAASNYILFFENLARNSSL
ncbi:hypothetical protein ABBQ32_005292 [Trebouxia sp. C0010 RCD-2024]